MKFLFLIIRVIKIEKQIIKNLNSFSYRNNLNTQNFAPTNVQLNNSINFVK